MQAFLISLTTLACLATALAAQAASTVDLSVSGLITPSACEPSLSNGGVYDLGKISASDLHVDQPTRLAVHNLPLAITCEASTLLAIEPRDNRLGSSYDESPTRFGLGHVSGDNKLGYLSLRLNSIMADGVGMYPLGSTTSSSWAPTSLLSNAFLTSFTSVPTGLTPTPIQQLNADLQITPTIAPASTLPLTEQMPIDGSVTLTMTYL
ncbi:DUF1120 domain-containing protein [Pseudomonas sp. 1152_12]|uniref:DUF1120 domain-containing protein n=1 Tax=Pseudomonas sp. 1152_12 TaxID=2604455 RepID=UPI0040636158